MRLTRASGMLTGIEWQDLIETDRGHTQQWGERFKRMKEISSLVKIF